MKVKVLLLVAAIASLFALFAGSAIVIQRGGPDAGSGIVVNRGGGHEASGAIINGPGPRA
jgi:hypothetical protein